MSVRPEQLHIVAQWIEKAEHDLCNAEHTLTLRKNCPYDTACFHAQQCVEKYLKAALCFYEVDFPRTHDLTELAARLPEGKFLKLEFKDLKELNPYAVETRYPGDWEPQTRQETKRAIQIAKHVRQILRDHLPKKLWAG